MDSINEFIGFLSLKIDTNDIYKYFEEYKKFKKTTLYNIFYKDHNNYIKENYNINTSIISIHSIIIEIYNSEKGLYFKENEEKYRNIIDKKEVYNIIKKEYKNEYLTDDIILKYYTKKEQNKYCFDIIKNISKELFIKQEINNIWNNSFLENINNLKIDFCGKIGEMFIIEICKISEINYNHFDDKNSKDGIYDIILFNKKIEIKTSRIGNNKSFQHESLKNYGCDFYMFIDLKPELFYITILPKFDFDKRSDIIGRKPHLRKNSNGIYKFDFSENNLLKSIKMGNTLKVISQTTIEEIYNFIYKLLN